MDEADLLGDRIAIMAGGSLQCCGSSFFLKKKYGAGYHLVIAKSQRCDVGKVTSLLRHHIPSIEVENNVGSELTYILSEEQSAVFQEMLSDLEDNSLKLGIDSYGISLTTMEEVFMKVGADHGQEEENDHIEMLNRNGDAYKEKNGHIVDSNSRSSETKLNMQENDFLTGWPLWRNHVLAMFMKKVLSTVRSWILFLIQNIIPVAFLIIAIIVARQMNASNDLPDLDITLDSYDNPITVMTTDNVNNNIFNQYREMLQTEYRESIDWGITSMHYNMLNATVENTARVRMRYIIGATFSGKNDTITAWFNNEPYHSPPLTLQYAINSIVKSKLGLDYSISFSNFPLPFTIDTQFARLAQGSNMGFQLAFNIAFSMSFVSSFYVLFYVRERVNKSKHLQFVSGAKVSSFWLIAFVWDYMTFIFTSLCLIITLACFQEDGFKTGIELGRMLAILMFFGFSMLPMMYISSFFFTIPSSGYTRMTLLSIFLGVAAFMVVQVLSVEDLDLTHVANGLHWGFLIIPHYALATAIHTVSLIFSTQSLCDAVNEVGDSILNITGLPDTGIADYACIIQPERCCDIEQDYFSWTNGIGRNVVFMLVVGIVLFVILLSHEYRVFDIIIYCFKRQIASKPSQEGTKDSDVMEEKRRIRSGEISFKDHCVLLKDVTRYYGKTLAVNQLCLGIKEYECFGLLGINGAGKTSTFKMMTGDVKISYGDGWINGMNLKTEMKKVHKHIGYCPQFDALLDDLTGKETLVMYCLLRGIRLKDSWHIAEQLSRDFDFHRHLNKQVKNYSGGSKRKLSAALALIGDPPIIFLDEPTTGMDPATKRNLWDTLCKIRDSGKCLILTSHSMEECEALCTRLAIMVNGTFKCLGSTQHLKNKFSEGYMLTIKVRKANTDTHETATNIEAIEHLVKSNFPSAIPKESHQELVTYFIPDVTLPWSKMFGIMEDGKKSISVIEDYSLGQSSLEQVFLLFTKQQRE
ncbi:ABC transporter ATP-binding protein [Oryctes borbonicus]|uniref:ABC transporter ATP-binding protein n=1 Tax=Oryctes borbonicus TaxID=1629725 RepID=A0A0T6BDG1_9SCAR|nr:ABC transporter ATP-binding protein [Oryctes borbonicus]